MQKGLRHNLNCGAGSAAARAPGSDGRRMWGPGFRISYPVMNSVLQFAVVAAISGGRGERVGIPYGCIPRGSTEGCSLPQWKPRWSMSESTYGYCYRRCPLDALHHASNSSSTDSSAGTSVWGGLVGVDHYWTNQGLPCVNGLPSEYAQQDAFAAATKAQFPAAKVLQYRIVTAEMYDPIVHDLMLAHPEYFVRWHGTGPSMF